MKHKNYTAYLFDLDGTLVDTAPDIMKGLNYALQQAAFETVDELLTRRWVGHGARVLIEKALEHYGENRPSQELLETMTSNFITHYAEHIADDSNPYPNVTSTLETLSNEGKQLGVVTNKAVHLARLLLKATELDQFMNVIVGGDSMQVRKHIPKTARATGKTKRCSRKKTMPMKTAGLLLFLGSCNIIV